MRVVCKFFGVGVTHNQDIAVKFIGVDVVWLGGISPTSNYKRKISLDLLITKFTKRHLSLNFQFSSSLYFVYYF